MAPPPLTPPSFRPKALGTPRVDSKARSPWPLLPTLGFLAVLFLLAVAAALSIVAPTPILTGLPDDPDAHKARAALAGRSIVHTGSLEFRSALGGATEDGTLATADRAAVTTAEASLLRATKRHPRDPRIVNALAHLDLAAGRLDRAERRYRAALDLAPTYGEARLGLGVALALQAETLDDPARYRGLRLQAIAQFAAVPEADPQYPLALGNRVRMLREVGRAREAERLLARSR
ncbi:MAG TPA: hypothetical protein VEY91_00495 [Candidatus Limnocylindria bacterium]|nr:hypothetical protein [Candidatus Limnocylindria bacterium]